MTFIALLVVMVGGLLFESGHWVSLACLIALVVLHPLALLVLILVVAGVALFFINSR